LLSFQVRQLSAECKRRRLEAERLGAELGRAEESSDAASRAMRSELEAARQRAHAAEHDVDGAKRDAVELRSRLGACEAELAAERHRQGQGPRPAINRSGGQGCCGSRPVH
jgi:chromosome segregation ATPase